MEKWIMFLEERISESRLCCHNFFPFLCVCAGNYRTQLYDKQREEYLPATQGLGMFVEVRDPDEKVSSRHTHTERGDHGLIM